MGRQLNYMSDPDCKEADEYSESLFSDPMTQHYGMGGEVFEQWMRKHIKTCKECRQATMEASMP